jgi:hypothetical protein
MDHQDAGCGPICGAATVVPELARYVVRGRRVTKQTARARAAVGYVVCVVPELRHERECECAYVCVSLFLLVLRVCA